MFLLAGPVVLAVNWLDRHGVDTHSARFTAALHVWFWATMILGFGLYLALIPPGRGLHDYLAGTRVVQAEMLMALVPQRGFAVVAKSDEPRHDVP